MHLMQGFTAGCVSHQVKWPADMADGDSCKRMPLTSYTASLREKMSLIVASFKMFLMHQSQLHFSQQHIPSNTRGSAQREAEVSHVMYLK